MIRMTWQWLCMEIRVIKWYYWLIAIILFCFAYHLSKKTTANKEALASGTLVTHIFLIIVSTLINRGTSVETYNLVPFWTIRAFLSSGKKDVVSQAFLNVVLFLPFGFLNAIVVHSFYQNKSNFLRSILTIIPGTLLSIVIEIAQFIVHRGLCEIDDVIHNTFGAIIGYCCWLLTVKVSKFINRNNKKRSE